MHPAAPSIRVSWCTLDGDVWRGVAEEGGHDGEVCVSLTKSVVYSVYGVWGLKVV